MKSLEVRKTQTVKHNVHFNYVHCSCLGMHLSLGFTTVCGGNNWHLLQRRQYLTRVVFKGSSFIMKYKTKIIKSNPLFLMSIINIFLMEQHVALTLYATCAGIKQGLSVFETLTIINPWKQIGHQRSEQSESTATFLKTDLKITTTIN